MDDIDMSLLAMLRENARRSYAELGREVGLSTPSTAERVRRLEESGVIRGYTTNLAVDRFGYGMGAYVRLSNTRKDKKTTVQELEKLPEVLECYRVTGEECFVLRIVFSSMEHFEQLMDQIGKLGSTASSIIVSEQFQRTPDLSRLAKGANRKSAVRKGQAGRQ